MYSTGKENIWKSLQGTPAQMGITYAVKVFSNQNLTPGATQALQQNPPFRFVIGTQQALLPPENLIVGGGVPYLPDGLTVVWNTQFMGLPIPSDMISPVAVNGKLVIQPLEIMSAGGSGNQTNAKLVANNKVLLNLLMSVTGAIVNSYSSHPYSNPLVNGPGTSGAFNALSSYILQYRNKVDFLVPNQEQKTFVGGIIQSVVPIYENVVEPLVDAAANVVAPGSGVALSAAQKNALNPALNNATQAQKIANKINTALGTELVPESLAESVGNNWYLYVLGLILFIIIIWIILKK